MEIKGLKIAVGDYQRANSEGRNSSRYGYLMYDKATGEIWVDEFYSLGHNEWKEYHSESIINLGKMMEARNIDVTMKNVKEVIEKHIR